MSEPYEHVEYLPEYDLGTQGGYEQAKLDPGLPEEMVQEIAAEPAPVVGFNFELVYELTPIVGAVLITVAAVELLKGLGLRQLLKRRFSYGEEARTTVYKWVTLLVSFPVSVGWGFREVVLDTTGVQLSWAETFIYGGLLVATGARLFYEWHLAQIAKDKLYKWLGVDEKNAPEHGGSGHYMNPWTRDAEAVTDEEEEDV